MARKPKLEEPTGQAATITRPDDDTVSIEDEAEQAEEQGGPVPYPTEEGRPLFLRRVGLTPVLFDPGTVKVAIIDHAQDGLLASLYAGHFVGPNGEPCICCVPESRLAEAEIMPGSYVDPHLWQRHEVVGADGVAIDASTGEVLGDVLEWFEQGSANETALWVPTDRLPVPILTDDEAHRVLRRIGYRESVLATAVNELEASRERLAFRMQELAAADPECVHLQTIIDNAERIEHRQGRVITWLRDRFTHALGIWARSKFRGSKTHETPYGRVSVKTYGATLKVTDDEEALELYAAKLIKAGASEAVRRKVEILVTKLPKDLAAELLKDPEKAADHGFTVKPSWSQTTVTTGAEVKNGVGSSKK